MNYIEVENKLNDIINSFEHTKNKNHPFKGHNFMTNYVIKKGQFKNGIWVEVSYGRFMDNWIYGLTFKGNEQAENLSGCYGLEEIENILNKVSKINADTEFKKDLYTYLNDDHIETALRKICPKVVKKY